VSRKQTFVIPVSNGILEGEHREKIRSAIWLFLWLIDRTTIEQPSPDGTGLEGLVLGGKAIATRFIAEQIGESERAVRYHLDQLEEHGYIRRIEHRGLANGYALRKSKKWQRVQATILGPEMEHNPGKELPESDEEPGQEVADPSAENCRTPGKNCRRNKEYKTETLQGQSRKPLRKRKHFSSDTRFLEFVEDLKKYRDFLSGEGKFTFTPQAGKNLNLLLGNNPSFTREQFQACLSNRARSVKAGHYSAAEEIHKWITSVREFEECPLDRYGKPMQQSGDFKNADHSKAQRVEDRSIDAIKQAASRMAGAAVGRC
jgi:DNA-binding transcriptional ArsR family regulator